MAISGIEALHNVAIQPVSHWEFDIEGIEDSNNLNYKIQSVNLPFLNLTTDESSTGRKYYTGIDTVGDFSIDVFEDTDFSVYDFFMGWLDSVYDMEQRVFRSASSPEELVKSAELRFFTYRSTPTTLSDSKKEQQSQSKTISDSKYEHSREEKVINDSKYEQSVRETVVGDSKYEQATVPTASMDWKREVRKTVALFGNSTWVETRAPLPRDGYRHTTARNRQGIQREGYEHTTSVNEQSLKREGYEHASSVNKQTMKREGKTSPESVTTEPLEREVFEKEKEITKRFVFEHIRIKGISEVSLDYESGGPLRYTVNLTADYIRSPD